MSNSIEIYAQKPKWYDFTGILIVIWQLLLHSYVPQMRAKGYKVDYIVGNSETTFKNMWKADGILGFIFVGQRTDAYFPQVNVDDSGEASVGPWDVKPPYKLRIVHMLACGSANSAVNSNAAIGDMKMWAWSDHVSEDGLFIGFIGAVNMLNIEDQIRDNRDDM